MAFVFPIFGKPAGTPAAFDDAAQTNDSFAEGARSISLDVPAGGVAVGAAFRSSETNAAFSGLDFNDRVNRREARNP